MNFTAFNNFASLGDENLSVVAAANNNSLNNGQAHDGLPSWKSHTLRIFLHLLYQSSVWILSLLMRVKTLLRNHFISILFFWVSYLSWFWSQQLLEILLHHHLKLFETWSFLLVFFKHHIDESNKPFILAVYSQFLKSWSVVSFKTC